MSTGFRVPLKHFKRNYLAVPQELVALVGSTDEKTPLRVRDGEDEYVLVLHTRSAVIEGLGQWYRTRNPADGDEAIITPIDVEHRVFAITLKSGSGKPRPSGLYLGRKYNTVGASVQELADKFYLPLEDLPTHVFICGTTGSGKTVLGKALIEEAALHGIPSLVVDLKGDLSSLALAPRSFEPSEFEIARDERNTPEGRTQAVAQAERHQRELEHAGLGESDLAEFAQHTEVRIFTPRSQKGRPLSFGSQLAAPPNARELYKRDHESFNNLLSSLRDAFMDRLYPGTKRTKIENEREYVFEVVKRAWLDGVDLGGLEGVRRLLRLVEHPPFEVIGGLPVDQYIGTEKRLERLVNKINTLLSGSEPQWFEGDPVSMDLFLRQENGRTPINVVNVTELDRFEDRSFVVAHLAYKLREWMTKQATEGEPTPRFLLFIDEIGGGGGKQALFPSPPYECAAKYELAQLVRQGRAFGVCCVFATQNPGDIDYKALSNVHTWFVGNLATQRDRGKILEGMQGGRHSQIVNDLLIRARTGEFVARMQGSEMPIFIKVRWLRTIHRVLTMEEVSRITRMQRGEPVR